MTSKTYFVGAVDKMTASDAAAISGVFSFPINYAALARLLDGKRVFVAIDNPETFLRVDDGFCRAEIYDRCKVEICDDIPDFGRA